MSNSFQKSSSSFEALAAGAFFAVAPFAFGIAPIDVAGAAFFEVGSLTDAVGALSSKSSQKLSSSSHAPDGALLSSRFNELAPVLDLGFDVFPKLMPAPEDVGVFSEDVPELLIADLGPDFEHLQVCLQPHVYSAPSADEDASERPPLRGSKGRGKANRTDPFRYVDYDGCDVRYEETARYAGTRSQDGSLRERQRSVRDADFRRHMLGTSGYAPSVASSASEQQRFRPRLSPPSVGGGNRFDGGHTEFRFDKMIERLGGLSK
eukprot:CAMPEP_0169406700 /NCGR_PEP_ID=MMETSP1017-20121227/57676_1 /TAXON_ID=342587 /ORGANISM="Karlodinium micrum, Strain CCMP2283" /LENGTH=262 /DNA_ID=CAMNT_0009513493 /DNA_START=148 /DNA_END=933 /DNA_ORIENTATION=+